MSAVAALLLLVIVGVCSLLALLIWDDVVAPNLERWRNER